jgi:hypothetical protein
VELRTLIDTAKAKGLTFRVDGDRIRIEAASEPDSETKALLEMLRTHRDELRSILSAPPPCWNCGATMTKTADVSGRTWWVCWECAVSA